MSKTSPQADDAPAQPIILPAGPLFLRDRAAIAQVLLERRIPSIVAFRENMEAGALISYRGGPGRFRQHDFFRRVAGEGGALAGGWSKMSDEPLALGRVAARVPSGLSMN